MLHSLLDSLPGVLIQMGIVYGILIVGTLIQDLRPFERGHPSADVRMTYLIGFTGFFAGWLLGPVSGAASVAIVNALGAGWIPLSADGWRFLPSLLAYLIAQDALEYWMHRAQHKVPFLWAMHRLHHSEEAYAARTTTRHFWLEAIIKSAICYPLLAVFFAVPLPILFAAGLIYTVNHVAAHMNVRLSLGRFSLWIQNPQYHRIHHSTEPKHYDKNFADLLPLLDVIFGTAHRPADGEFPSTGLVPSAKPATLFESFVWPLHAAHADASSAGKQRSAE